MTEHENFSGRAGSLASIFGDTAKSIRDLVQGELALFKAETSESIRQAIIGLVAVILGAVFAIVAVTLLVESLVAWLAVVLASEALAAGLVAVLAAVIAAGAILYGINKITSLSPVPDRTIRSVRRDTEMMSEKVA